MTSAEAERNTPAAATPATEDPLGKPNSEWGNRVAELATLVVDTSSSKARQPKRGFHLGRPR